MKVPFYNDYSLISVNGKILTPEIVKHMISGDCWAVAVTNNAHRVFMKNTYALFELIGKCFNTDHPSFLPHPSYIKENIWRDSVYKNPDILLNQNYDTIEIYMFGSDGWKITGHRTTNGTYVLTGSCSKEFYERGNINNLLGIECSIN
jgi:hypothetical protein